MRLLLLRLRHRKLARRLKEMENRVDALHLETREKLLAVIGGLIVTWAYMENAIDGWVEVIHITGGAQEIQENLPPSLDRELDYIKKAWKTTKVSSGLKIEGEKILAEIHRLKDFRHKLVHGLADINSMEDTFAIHLWKVRGAERAEIKMMYTSDDILQKTTAIVALKQNLDDFVIRFATALAQIVEDSR